jgi:hypothetical protein
LVTVAVLVAGWLVGSVHCGLGSPLVLPLGCCAVCLVTLVVLEFVQLVVGSWLVAVLVTCRFVLPFTGSASWCG